MSRKKLTLCDVLSCEYQCEVALIACPFHWHSHFNNSNYLTITYKFDHHICPSTMTYDHCFKKPGSNFNI